MDNEFENLPPVQEKSKLECRKHICFSDQYVAKFSHLQRFLLQIKDKMINEDLS